MYNLLYGPFLLATLTSMKKALQVLARLGAAVGIFIVPAFAFAQTTAGSTELELGRMTKVIQEILNFVDGTLVPVIFAIAFIVFIWGVFTYFIAGGANEEKQKEGKKFIFYALIGFVLMISLWGIVNLLVGTLGFERQSRPCLPTFSGPCIESGSTDKN